MTKELPYRSDGHREAVRSQTVLSAQGARSELEAVRTHALGPVCAPAQLDTLASCSDSEPWFSLILKQLKSNYTHKALVGSSELM